jgi:ADP-heptose:LPS heptosyltransferase
MLPGVSPPPAHPLRDSSVERVAIVRLRVGIGDLVLTVPALRALRATRPDVRVTIVTWQEMNQVVERMRAYVDDLLPFPGYPGIPDRKPKGELIAPFFTLAKKQSFDLAIQMYGGRPAANEVTSMMGARRVGGFFTPGEWEADLTTHLPYPVRAPEVYRHLMLMEFLGADRGSDDLEFPLDARDEEKCNLLLRKHESAPRRYVVVHPGATATSRRWPPALFGRVADRLAAHGFDILVTGCRGEEALTSGVVTSMRTRAHDLCGQTSLGGFGAVISKAALLLCNDTGAAHVAAAVGTPTVTVFLSGDPRRWSGLDSETQRAVYADVPCRPCGLLDCPIDFRCARTLDPDAVGAEAEALLLQWTGP